MKDYKKILEKYPLLFESLDPQEPFSLFGFECEIGWYNIIEKACYVMYSDYAEAKGQLNYVQGYIDHFDKYVANKRSFDKNTSEEDMLKELNNSKETYSKKMEEAKKKLPKVVQVKEKFGTLRLYTDNNNEVSYAITAYAELMSEDICEMCGNAGKTYRMSWHKTLCRQHAVERYGEERVLKYEAND
jgi:organic radical activating enzyme